MKQVEAIAKDSPPEDRLRVIAEVGLEMVCIITALVPEDPTRRLAINSVRDAVEWCRYALSDG